MDGIRVPSETQSIVDALARYGFEVDSISGALLFAPEAADRRYIAVAVPDIEAVHRLLEALAALDWRSTIPCRSVLFATDDSRPGIRFAVLVGIAAPEASALH
jgi:hypothetical protein